MATIESILLKIDFNSLIEKLDIDPKALSGSINIIGLPAFILLSSLFSLPVVILLGVTVDAATELTVRKWVKLALKSDFLVCLFFNRRDFRKKLFFEKKVERLLIKTKKYRFLLNSKKTDKLLLDGIDMSVGVGFFFRNANERAVDWVIQHYSVYLLATSCLFILSLFAFVLVLWGPVEGVSKLWIIATYLVLSYLLVYESVRKYLHTWEYTHSHNAVALCEDAGDIR
jgi:hypothetical protein